MAMVQGDQNRVSVLTHALHFGWMEGADEIGGLSRVVWDNDPVGVNGPDFWDLASYAVETWRDGHAQPPLLETEHTPKYTPGARGIAPTGVILDTTCTAGAGKLARLYTNMP